MSTLVSHISPARFAELLQSSGYRAQVVDQGGRPQVQSAAQGLGFFVAFGNAAVEAGGSYSDLSFQCLIAIDGQLPEGMVERWNQVKRFARLFRQGEMLILAMDVLLSGGVGEMHLRAQIELWDRVIREFVLHVKQQPLSSDAASAATAAAAAGSGA